jgi:hypothetical protein
MEDKERVVKTALDYMEGWYQADGERMERALFKHLAKRRVTPEGETWQVDKEWMVEATAAGRGRIENPAEGRREVTVLDLTEAMASVKIVSEKFVDYLHLVKYDGQWVIVNALWDYHNQ